MNNRKFPDDAKIGDKVIFKSDEEKEDYQRIVGYSTSDIIYGIITNTVDNIRVYVNWINHKGIRIHKTSPIYLYRLKFYEG